MKMKQKACFLVMFCLQLLAILPVNAQSFGYKTHTNNLIAAYSMPYRLFIPDNYDPAKKYPMVLFLHGAGE